MAQLQLPVAPKRAVHAFSRNGGLPLQLSAYIAISPTPRNLNSFGEPRFERRSTSLQGVMYSDSDDDSWTTSSMPRILPYAPRAPDYDIKAKKGQRSRKRSMDYASRSPSTSRSRSFSPPLAPRAPPVNVNIPDDGDSMRPHYSREDRFQHEPPYPSTYTYRGRPQSGYAESEQQQRDRDTRTRRVDTRRSYARPFAVSTGEWLAFETDLSSIKPQAFKSNSDRRALLQELQASSLQLKKSQILAAVHRVDDDGEVKIDLHHDDQNDGSDHIQWLHVQRDSFDLETMASLVDAAEGLMEKERLLSGELVQSLRTKYQLPDGRVFIPTGTTLRYSERRSYGEDHSPDLTVTFVLAPYFVARANCNRVNVISSRGLLGAAFPDEDIFNRDEEQIYSKYAARESKAQICVSQLWILLFDKVLLTISSDNVERHMRPLIEPRVIRSAQTILVRVTSPRGQIHYLDIDRLTSFFDLRERIYRQCLQYDGAEVYTYQLIFRGSGEVTAASWLAKIKQSPDAVVAILILATMPKSSIRRTYERAPAALQPLERPSDDVWSSNPGAWVQIGGRTPIAISSRSRDGPDAYPRSFDRVPRPGLVYGREFEQSNPVDPTAQPPRLLEFAVKPAIIRNTMAPSLPFEKPKIYHFPLGTIDEPAFIPMQRDTQTDALLDKMQEKSLVMRPRDSLEKFSAPSSARQARGDRSSQVLLLEWHRSHEESMRGPDLCFDSQMADYSDEHSSQQNGSNLNNLNASPVLEDFESVKLGAESSELSSDHDSESGSSTPEMVPHLQSLQRMVSDSSNSRSEEYRAAHVKPQMPKALFEDDPVKQALPRFASTSGVPPCFAWGTSKGIDKYASILQDIKDHLQARSPGNHEARRAFTRCSELDVCELRNAHSFLDDSDVRRHRLKRGFKIKCNAANDRIENALIELNTPCEQEDLRSWFGYVYDETVETVGRFVPLSINSTATAKIWGSLGFIFHTIQRSQSPSFRSPGWSIRSPGSCNQIAAHYKIKPPFDAKTSHCHCLREVFASAAYAVEHLVRHHYRGKPSFPEAVLKKFVAPHSNTLTLRLFDLLKSMTFFTERYRIMLEEMAYGLANASSLPQTELPLPASLVTSFEVYVTVFVLFMRTVELTDKHCRELDDRTSRTLYKQLQHSRTLFEIKTREGLISIGKATHDVVLISREQAQKLTNRIDTVGLPFLALGLLTNLEARVFHETGDVLSLYERCLKKLQYRASIAPRKKLLQDIHHLVEEVEAVRHNLDTSWRILRNFEQVIFPASFRITDEERVRQYRLEEEYLNLQESAVGRRFRRAWNLQQRALELAARVKSSVEILEEDHGRAIMTFTTITTIFLPLSFVASVFGINTNDVRNMTGNQWIFWASAIPFTAIVTVLTILFAFKGSDMYERGRDTWAWWIQKGPRLVKGEERRLKFRFPLVDEQVARRRRRNEKRADTWATLESGMGA